MIITTDWLKEEDACADAVAWAAPWLGDGQPLSECIAGLDRADWLIWLLWRAGACNIRQIARLSAVCARPALRYVPAGEDRPRLAVEAADAWVAAPSEVTADAARAAEATVWAAGAAAWATRAAAGAAGDAAWAAGAAAGAAGDAAWAAEAAVRAAEHKKLSGLIRAELLKPGFLALEWPVR